MGEIEKMNGMRDEKNSFHYSVFFSALILLLALSCKKKEFKTVPDGYEEQKVEMISKYSFSCSDTSFDKNNLCDTLRGNLINCQNNFDYLFPAIYGKYCGSISRPDFPPINFSLQTLIIGELYFRGENAGIADTKVFINQFEKKIIIRGLVRNMSGGMTGHFSPSFIIEKVGSDFTIINEVVNPTLYQ